MSQSSEDIKRWTARRKATAVVDIIKGRTTAPDLARFHDLTVAEIEQWMDDFVSQGTEALRPLPRDADAVHKSREEELVAKIGELMSRIRLIRQGHLDRGSKKLCTKLKKMLPCED